MYHDLKRLKPTAEFWHRQRVIDGILEIYELGQEPERLSHQNIPLLDFQLYKAGIRLFGSWSSAVNAAGLDYEEISILASPEESSTKYLEEDEIIKRILNLYEAGEDLSSRYIAETYPELWRSASRRRNFGSWGHAIISAGLNYHEILARSGKSWNRKRILESIYEIYESVGDLSHKYIKQTYPSLLKAAKRYFRNWEYSVRHAGLNPERVQYEMQIEPFRIFVLKNYSNEIFKALSLKIEPMTTNQSDPNITDETPSVPSFIDNSTGVWVEIQIRSWARDLESSMRDHLKSTDSVIVYYLLGEPRKWFKNEVVFISLKDTYPELIQLGREDIIRDLNILERGRVPDKFMEYYTRYISQSPKGTA
jgi:hypothetical protein